MKIKRLELNKKYENNDMYAILNIEKESEKAVCVKEKTLDAAGEKEQLIWLPKSQIVNQTKDYIEIPEWLYDTKDFSMLFNVR